jgi:hydrogenase assembly chaperone HypC/HupF
MCLGDPARIVAIDGDEADVETIDGVQRVSLAVTTARGLRAHTGDWVLVSLGLALEFLDASDGEQLAEEHRRIRHELTSELMQLEQS